MYICELSIQVMKKRVVAFLYSLRFLAVMLLVGWGANACQSPEGAGGGAFSLQGSFPSCQMDSIRVYVVDGLEIKSIAAAPVVSSGETYRFELSGDLPQEGMYFVGQAPGNLIGVFLGAEKGVTLSGNCMNLRSFHKIENSPLNDNFNKINERLTQLKRASMTVNQEFRVAYNNDAQAEAEARDRIDELYQLQVDLYDSLKNEGSILAKIIAPNIYEPFDPSDPENTYPNELHHLAGEMFSYVDFSDPAYNQLPITDFFRMYVMQVFSGGMELEAAQQYLDALLSRIPEGSQLHKNVLASVINTMEQMSSLAFPKYAENFINLYQPKEQIVQTIRQRITFIEAKRKAQEEAERITGIGVVPPPIELPEPDGTPLALSSLRGKYVLLDFWASWCVPCRNENPNVVRIYQKYKNKGFEILGISLDQNRTQWLDAIENDQLTWLHVSDLKGWRSQAAQDYRVTAIPATFLLDKEGKVIAKNLRGASLERELASILGS